MIETLEKVFSAHGREEYWLSLEAIEARISAWGLLFTIKSIPVLDRVWVRALILEPRFTFFDFPQPGQRSEFIGDKEVHIANSSGNDVERRVHPRSAFRKLRRLFYWDSLDFIYFGGYATWNYLMTPFLFLRDGFKFEELGALRGAFGTWTRLCVTFPDDIPTHCKTQIFYFDENGFLRRLDYTAEVVGRWAHAAHLCDEYREFDGLKIPTRRRVVPRTFGNKPLPAPTLVPIEVHEMRPIRVLSDSESY